MNFSRASQFGQCVDGLAQEVAHGGVLQEVGAALTADVGKGVEGAGEGCRGNGLLL